MFALKAFVALLIPTFVVGSDLILTGVIDGPLSGGVPKAIELYALEDIPDLSIYGLGSANNGGGSDGQEFTFPVDTLAAGSFITVASEASGFNNFFGQPPTYTSGAALINGDDAIELFKNGAVVDVVDKFGDINVDGTGQPWEYMDGWAYRKSCTFSTSFVANDWNFSGPNALDTCPTDNDSCSTGNHFPLGSFVPTGCGGTSTAVQGDPHFFTWAGEHYEYHGQCDLQLLSDPGFANGKGLDIFVRSEIIRTWSYIKNAVIRIGDDILEVQGNEGKDQENHYWYNKEYQGKLAAYKDLPAKIGRIGGFPIYYHRHNRKSRGFEIDLKHDQKKILISTFKDFIRVDFKNADKALYGNTTGLLGDFATGKKLARDGVTVMTDYYKFGQEWQIMPNQPRLFHEVASPQFPEKCIVPKDPHAARARVRRLGESLVVESAAEAACGHVAQEENRKACISDVLATDDVEMAGAY